MNTIFSAGTLLLAMFFLVSCSKNDTKTEEFSLSFSCEPEQGSVEISPQKEKYTITDTVVIKANPANGYSFKEWSGTIYSEEKEIALVMNKNYILKALFEKIYTTNSSVLIEFKGFYNQEKDVWDFEVLLEDEDRDFIEGREISDATVKINTNSLMFNDFNDIYKGTINSFDEKAELNVSINQSDLGELDYSILLPPTFSKELQTTQTNQEISLSWETLNCDFYRIYRKVIYGSGSETETTLPNGFLVNGTSFSTTVNEILTEGISSNATPIEAYLWVCTVNRNTNLNNLNSESYIEIEGKASNHFKPTTTK